MKLYGQCEGCKKNKLFIRMRYITFPKPVGRISSKSELCRACIKNVKKMIKI